MTAERGPAGTYEYLLFRENGDIDYWATQKALVTNDTQLARTLAAEWQGGLNFEVPTGTWYIWDGQCHPPDDSGDARRLVMAFGERLKAALDACRQLVAARASATLPPLSKDSVVAKEAQKLWDTEGWAAAAKYAAGLHKSAGVSSALTALETVCGQSADAMAERNTGLINFADGTVDLATGVRRPHRQADMITYCLPVRWNPQARAPRFWDLLWHVGGQNAENVEYLVKLLGYCLLGDNREQKIIFISGPAGSGKSVLMHVISEVLGPLAHASGAELITIVRTGRNARKENSIRGKRLVTITETSKFMTIDEGQLKRITGEPVISVDQHYAKTELKTPVTWTIVVVTNDMPSLLNFDAAMRRRVIVFPGGETIVPELMDPRLADKILSTEREGIVQTLAWGCRRYFYDGGLAMPADVAAATELYAAEQNTVADFVADTMVLGGWGEGIAQHDAWVAYEQWSRGGSKLGKITFYDHLRKVPGITHDKHSRRFGNVAWNLDWAARAR